MSELDAVMALAEATHGTVLCPHCNKRNSLTADQEHGHDGAVCGACGKVMWYPTCWVCVAVGTWTSDGGCVHTVETQS